MIVTVTLNPAVDCLLELDTLETGKLNRARYQKFSAGGKGINVSMILNTLGTPSVATGFIGGFTGEFILSELSKASLKTDFIKIKEATRLNVKLEVLDQTEINATSPKVSDQEFNALLDMIHKLSNDDLLVLAGSSIEDRNAYLKIVKIALEKNIPFICDVEKKALAQLLPFQPLLIKPNLYELESFIKKPLNSEKEILDAAFQLLDMGAQNIIVSLGKNGSYFINKSVIYKANLIEGIAKNAVGAGDSMIGGFLSEYQKTQDVYEAYKWAVASGTATAFSYQLGTLEEINNMVQKVTIKEVNYENQRTHK